MADELFNNEVELLADLLERPDELAEALLDDRQRVWLDKLVRTITNEDDR